MTLFPPIFANIINSGNKDYAYLFVLGFALGVIFLFAMEALFASIFRKMLTDKVFIKIAIVLNSAILVTAGYFIYRFVDMVMIY